MEGSPFVSVRSQPGSDFSDSDLPASPPKYVRVRVRHLPPPVVTHSLGLGLSLSRGWPEYHADRPNPWLILPCTRPVHYHARSSSFLFGTFAGNFQNLVRSVHSFYACVIPTFALLLGYSLRYANS